MSLSRIQRTVLPIAVMALLGGCLGCAVRSPQEHLPAQQNRFRIFSSLARCRQHSGGSSDDSHPSPPRYRKPKEYADAGLFDQRTLVLFVSGCRKFALLDRRDAKRVRISTERRNHRHEGPVADLCTSSLWITAEAVLYVATRIPFGETKNRRKCLRSGRRCIVLSVRLWTGRIR